MNQFLQEGCQLPDVPELDQNELDDKMMVGAAKVVLERRPSLEDVEMKTAESINVSEVFSAEVEVEWWVF